MDAERMHHSSYGRHGTDGSGFTGLETPMWVRVNPIDGGNTSRAKHDMYRWNLIRVPTKPANVSACFFLTLAKYRE